MDVARCVDDKTLYHISGFLKLSDFEIESKRYSLICESCSSKAYFRTGNDQGIGACFGARPHVKGCILSSDENAKIAAGIFDEKDKKNNEGKIIKITFPAEGEDEIVNPVESEDATGGKSRAGRYEGGSSPSKTNFRRSLRKILLALILQPDFAKSDMQISIGANKYSAKDLFVNLDQDDDSSLNERIYWGVVKKIKNFGTHAFLDGNNLGININSFLFEDLKNKAKIKDLQDLEKCYIIGCGKKQNGLIKIFDINKLEVIKKFDF